LSSQVVNSYRFASGGGASRSTASDNAMLCGGSPYPNAIDTSQYWNGTVWDNTVTVLPSARVFGVSGGNYDDYLFAGGTGHFNGSAIAGSSDTFEWNGSSWASATPYPQTYNIHIIGCGGGNTTSAFIHAGHDGYTSTPYYKTYSGVWNGTAWSESVASTYGGQATSGGGLPDDFIATGGYGFNGGASLVETWTCESFDGNSWTNEASFPTDGADGTSPFAYGCFSAGGRESFLAFCNSTSLTNVAFTYDGTSWVSAGTLVENAHYSASNGDTTSAITAGGADNGFDLTGCQLYNGDQTFTSVASIGTGATAMGMGANTV